MVCLVTKEMIFFLVSFLELGYFSYGVRRGFPITKIAKFFCSLFATKVPLLMGRGGGTLSQKRLHSLR
jgi:hypothetical protein